MIIGLIIAGLLMNNIWMAFPLGAGMSVILVILVSFPAWKKAGGKKGRVRGRMPGFQNDNNIMIPIYGIMILLYNDNAVVRRRFFLLSERCYTRRYKDGEGAHAVYRKGRELRP